METIMQTQDVRIIELRLNPTENVPWHHHTQVIEHCYCLSDQVEVQQDDEARCNAAGEKLRIEPGCRHKLRNNGRVPASLLVIQGLGKFDFIPAERP